MKATFNLNNSQLSILQNKAKICSFLSNNLTRSFFKVDNNSFTLFQRGSAGAFSINVPIECNTVDNFYYSVDYNKWTNALQKFANYSEVCITINKNMLTLYAPKTVDTINLSILTFTEDSPEAILIDSFISSRKADVINEDLELVLDEGILENFNLVDSLFSSQGKVNSIGFSKNETIYSDRSVVLRASSVASVEDSFFDKLGSEDYVYIHSFFLKLFNLLAKTNTSVYFSNDYETIYWEDETSKLVLTSESRDVALPTNEQWEMIKPQEGAAVFNTNIASLNESLSFFTGFYEETAWKPVVFEIENNKVNLYYRHPTTEISKALNTDVVNATDGSFMISSETVSKILNKISSRFSPEALVTVMYDEDSPGVYCKIDCDAVQYEIVLSKLVDILQD